MADAGWAGFWPYDGAKFFLTLMALGSPPTNPKANSTLQAFYDTISKIPGVFLDLQVTKPYSGFQQWYEDNFINSTNGIGFNYTVGDFSGVPVAVSSRLLPRENFENNPEVLAKALANFTDARPLSVLPSCSPLLSKSDSKFNIPSLVGGGAVSRVPVDAASVNPAFRVMLSDLTIALSWNVTTASFADITAVQEIVTGWADSLRVLTPTSGAYVNEVGFCLDPRL